MSITDYKDATAKLREFSEYYEENRYKTWYEKAMDAKRKYVYECIERMVWGVIPNVPVHFTGF